MGLLHVSDTYSDHVHYSEAGRHNNTILQGWWYNIHSTWTPLTQAISKNNFVNILYFNVYYKPYIYNLIFYICKLILMSFVTYPLENISLTKVIRGGQNMQEAYDVYSVINSRIFISTCWFYSHNLIDLNFMFCWPCILVQLWVNVLNEGITMCLEIKYYNISVRQHNLIIYL